MDSLKDKDNFTFPQAIIMLGSLDSIKRREEVPITGQGRNLTLMRASSKQEREMEEEPSGGLMAVGMKAISRMEFNVEMELFTGKVEIVSMRDSGKMECLMVKALNTLTTDSVTKVTLNKTNSMVTESSIKTTP